jgi:hypothetical protein
MTFRRLASVAAACAFALVAASGALAAQPYPVSFHSFPLGAGLTLPAGAATSTWTGPVYTTGFGFTELVASWNADTPPGTWIEVDMRGTTDKGVQTKWYVMGKWAYDDADFHRTSVGGQGDENGYIAVDTFFAKDHPLTSYQLRVTLNRFAGTASPRVTRVGAVASDAPNAKPSIPSATTITKQIDLGLPTYSQEIHAGQYPQFDGGGEAWCSPTSTSMVVAYWGRGPSAADYGYVLQDYPGIADPWVDYAARYTFDYRYNGAGNWPFNTAYAAHWGLEAEVTQLHSLAEAEQFVKAGIPLVASVAFQPNKLDGFMFKGTDGHLLVIGGFTASGDPIVYDPASPSDSAVRHVYDREQFERAWLPATGGIVYVIHPAGTSLPTSAYGNW